MLLFLTYTVLSQAVLLELRFIHNNRIGRNFEPCSWDVKLLSCFPIKAVAVKRHPKVRLSPWRTGAEKYPLQSVDPRSHLICTPPRRATPPCSPLFLVTGGYAPHLRRLIRTPVQGGYPRYHSTLSPPRGLLTPRFKRFPATRILPITSCVCSVWYLA